MENSIEEANELSLMEKAMGVKIKDGWNRPYYGPIGSAAFSGLFVICICIAW